LAKIKLVISEPATGKASNMELEGTKAKPFVGKELGENLDGSLIGLSGKRVKITGGSDKDGIPLRSDVLGGGKKHLVLTKSVGFRGEYGIRERKMVRGRMITEETYQINVVVVEAPTEPKTVTEPPKAKSRE
jgi:small subunit ribosomal protein S6e